MTCGHGPVWGQLGSTPIAMPMFALLRAGASFTPSPVIACTGSAYHEQLGSWHNARAPLIPSGSRLRCRQKPKALYPAAYGS